MGSKFRIVLGGLAVAFIVGGLAIAQTTPKGGDPEAAKIKSPIASGADSIAKGKAVFTERCVPCHGVNADGQGDQVPALGTKPANLTRPQYTHGTSDGEIFTNVKNGILPDLNMPPWDGIVPDTDIWNVVNYLRTMRKPG
jgi:mono/diheme cytochrome c family protein